MIKNKFIEYFNIRPNPRIEQMIFAQQAEESERITQGGEPSSPSIEREGTEINYRPTEMEMED